MTSKGGVTPQALQLKPNMEALGVVLTFICKSSPYADFKAAKIISAIQHQLTTGCHVCLIADEQLVAYAGWLPIDKSDGERWMKGEVNLRPVPSSATKAAALTVVCVTSRSHIPQLIRACRRAAPQQIIYFKRDYAGGRSKKSKVANRQQSGSVTTDSQPGGRGRV